MSIIVVGTIVIGSHLNKMSHPWLPMATENCELGSLNVTMAVGVPKVDQNPEDVPWFFRISFLYYSVISSFIFAVVAVPVSLFTRDPNDRSYEEMDQRLLAPFRRDMKLYNKQMMQRDENSHQMKSLISEEGDAKNGCDVNKA